MSRDGRRFYSRSKPGRPGAASEGERAFLRVGSPLVITIVVALLAAALLLFAYDSSEPATVDAEGPGAGMSLQFFPNTSATGSPCTGKCVGVIGETFSIDVMTNPAPPAGFSAYRINITYSGVKLIAQDRVDENRVPTCNPLLVGPLNYIDPPGTRALSCNNADLLYEGALANFQFVCNPGTTQGFVNLLDGQPGGSHYNHHAPGEHIKQVPIKAPDSIIINCATPTPTPTDTSTPTDTPTDTPTPTDTLTPTDTFTPTDTPTDTDTPTGTITPPTHTFTPTHTNTPRNTNTPTNSPTLTPSNTPTPSDTPVPSDTPTPTITSTPVPTWTPEPTWTPAATWTPFGTPTVTPTQVRNTPTPTPTRGGSTSTPTVTSTPGGSTPTPTPTVTSTPGGPTSTPPGPGGTPDSATSTPGTPEATTTSQVQGTSQPPGGTPTPDPTATSDVLGLPDSGSGIGPPGGGAFIATFMGFGVAFAGVIVWRSGRLVLFGVASRPRQFRPAWRRAPLSSRGPPG